MQRSPEVQFVLELATARSADVDIARCRDIMRADSFDWDRVVALCSRHRVLPLVARTMSRLGLERLSHCVHASFDTAIGSYFYHRERNRALTAEFADIHRHLSTHVPRVAVRKGMYLANCVYRDAGLRPMADLDLLIDPADSAQALKAMEQLGYHAGRPTDDLRRITPISRAELRYWQINTNNLPPLRRPTSDPHVRLFVVDFSTSITPTAAAGRASTADILDRSVALDIGGTTALVEAPEDLVLDLCAHIYKESTTLRYIHRRKHQRLIQYCDVREALRHHRESFDWAAFRKNCAAADLDGPCYFALTHLNQLFPGSAPDDVVAELGAGVSRDFLDQYGASEEPTPLRWRIPFPERMFSSASLSDVPTSKTTI
ncbi:nucleotidyltransferase family protein [Nocardia sp. R6R-6]|uniref:nucleotidyltransferase family protein n=1 Tax=Nocardia sp. R6R-6 TaxID=3459303 RepID=UPI00403DA5DA